MKIYVDMDGVVANFEKRYIELFRETPGDSRDRKEFSQNWTDFVEGRNFSTLDWWPGGKELVEYLKTNFKPQDVEFLTSSGGHKYHNEVTEQKNEWIRNNPNIPSEWTVNVVSGRRTKANYATPDCVLIDDTQDVIEAFRKAGGIAIHHKDITNTLMMLDILRTKA